jgi:hypothetical protein
MRSRRILDDIEGHMARGATTELERKVDAGGAPLFIGSESPG